MAALRASSTRPEMGHLVDDETLLAAWKGMTEGATKPGPHGAADRAALGRVLGLPLAQFAGHGAAKQPGARSGIEVRDRLQRAVSGARGHGSVTRAGDGAEYDEQSAA